MKIKTFAICFTAIALAVTPPHVLAQGYNPPSSAVTLYTPNNGYWFRGWHNGIFGWWRVDGGYWTYYPDSYAPVPAYNPGLYVPPLFFTTIFDVRHRHLRLIPHNRFVFIHRHSSFRPHHAITPRHHNLFVSRDRFTTNGFRNFTTTGRSRSLFVTGNSGFRHGGMQHRFHR